MLNRLENAPRFLGRLRRGKNTTVSGEESIERQAIIKWAELMYAIEFEVEYGLSMGRYGPHKGYYYTFSPGKEGNIIFIDTDREKGKGERYAVYPKGMQGFYFLRTINPIDPHNERNPHTWRIVTGKEAGKGIEEVYKGLKKSKVHNGQSYWKGRMPDRKEVLEIISSPRK